MDMRIFIPNDTKSTWLLILKKFARIKKKSKRIKDDRLSNNRDLPCKNEFSLSCVYAGYKNF